MSDLTPRQRRFLTILVPDGATICVGWDFAESLYWRGMLTKVKARFGSVGPPWRYAITQAGREALAGLASHASGAAGGANGAGRGNRPAPKRPMGRPANGPGTGAGNRGRNRPGTGANGAGETGQLTLI